MLNANLPYMRILVSPDCFTGTLTSAEAAIAISKGWHETYPDDQIEIAPLSDGGPGFVSAIATSLNATEVPVIVTGPLGEKVPAQFALLGNRAWIESAQACGLHLVEKDNRDPEVTTTFGVGELILAAIDAGANEITIGLGGSGTNDGGAGMLAALGAKSDGELAKGGVALNKVTKIDLTAALAKVSNINLICASDVDNPLLGLRGATNTFAKQKGADEESIMRLEGALENFAQVCGRRSDGKDPAVALGAGAAGGLGYGLILLGAKRVAGIETVMQIVGLDEKIAANDLVITGEGCLDDQSLHGKVAVGVASHCTQAGKPCVVIAGEVRLGKRECLTAGVDAAYSMSEFAGKERSLNQAQQVIGEVAARVAKTWGRRT